MDNWRCLSSSLRLEVEQFCVQMSPDRQLTWVDMG